LHSALIQECLLHWMQAVALSKAFNCGDLLLGDIAYTSDARSTGLAVDQDSAGSALAFAAAVLAPGQVEMVAQDEQQAGIGDRVGAIDAPVDV
jgi:hypothetical protein